MQQEDVGVYVPLHFDVSPHERELEYERVIEKNEKKVILGRERRRNVCTALPNYQSGVRA
jgi:hypothetical protein